jgi:CAAX protease family protein
VLTVSTRPWFEVEAKRPYAAARVPPGPPRPPPFERKHFVRMALGFYAGVLALAWLGSRLSGHSLLYASPAAAASGVAWARDPALGALAAAFGVLGSEACTRFTRWGARTAQALAGLLGPLGLRDCLLLAAASGVAEEALFRGALQPQVGWVVASLIFGLAHIAPRRELLPWTGLAIVAGFVLGGLFEVTGNLVAPVVAHFGINAINLRILSRRHAAR